MEIGTEDDPYCSQLEITLHGKKYDPHMPIYGNKGIAVRRGTLEMHGMKRETTWTTLTATSNAGSSILTVDATLTGLIDPVTGNPLKGWESGDQIVITSSNQFGVIEESEVHTIDTVSGSTIQIMGTLAYKHYGDLD